MEPQHTSDMECTVDPKDDCCVVCGVYHGEQCLCCGGRGFHVEGCIESDSQLAGRLQ